MSAISSVSRYSAAANNSVESISAINVCLTASDTSTRISPSFSTLTKSQTINLPSIGKDSSMSAISAGCKLASKRSSLLIFCLFTKFLMIFCFGASCFSTKVSTILCFSSRLFICSITILKLSFLSLSFFIWLFFKIEGVYLHSTFK